MINNPEENTLECCNECVALNGKGRHALPHKYLVQTDFKAVLSQFGNVDEYYYECRKCCKTWLHETGSYGHGWQQ